MPDSGGLSKKGVVVDEPGLVQKGGHLKTHAKACNVAKIHQSNACTFKRQANIHPEPHPAISSRDSIASR